MGKKYYRAGKRRLSRGALRLYLLDFPDERLADMGLSRDLLNEGVHAWPWRLSPITGDASREAARLAQGAHRGDSHAVDVPAYV